MFDWEINLYEVELYIHMNIFTRFDSKFTYSRTLGIRIILNKDLR